jgi:hypothetical protein
MWRWIHAVFFLMLLTALNEYTVHDPFANVRLSIASKGSKSKSEDFLVDVTLHHLETKETSV